MSPTASANTLVRRRTSHSRAAPRRRRSSLCLPVPNFDGSDSDTSDAASSPLPTLASIRILALAQLAEIDACLASARASASEDVDALVDDACGLVRKIREVCSHLPDVHLDVGAIEALVTHHLPDWSDVRSQLPALSLDTVRTKLAEIELPDIRSRLPDWERVLPAMRAELSALDDRLQALSLSAGSGGLLGALLDRITASDFFDDWRASEEENERKELEMVVTTASQIDRALRDSDNGSRYLTFHQLPDLWKNNEYVLDGYRFIPLSRWGTLAMSAFCLHNETLSIHTHFLPLIISLVSYRALGPSAEYVNTPDMIYTWFARLCLLTSAIWHCFAGCAHPGALEFFARLDYVGIGWLISASIATVVYFSLSCHSTAAYFYLSACAISAIVGSFLPFMKWFNERKHKKWRLLYFILLALSGIAPCVHLGLIHSPAAVFNFVWPIVPSILAYGGGVVFYASHFPECMYPQNPQPSWAHACNSIGLTSHAIWHLFILLGIWLHRAAVITMSSGFEGELCRLWN